MIAGLRRLWAGFGSLRVRLTLWYVLLLALILAGFCTFIYLRLLRDLYTEADRLLVDEARGLSTALQTGDETNVDGLLADVPAGTIVVVTDSASGRVLASQSGSPQAAADLSAMAIQPGADMPVQSVTLAGDPTWRLVTLTVTDTNDTQWVVRVARSDRDVVAALRQLLVQMAFGVPLALLVAVASGLFLGRSGAGSHRRHHAHRGADWRGGPRPPPWSTRSRRAGPTGRHL